MMHKNPITIIAEAGVNHNGDINLAYGLIDAAADAGADYVKFQSFNAEELVAETAQLADYQKLNTKGSENSQFEMLKKLELSPEQHFLLKNYAESKNVKFNSTAFNHFYIDFLFDLGIDFFKVPSGEITNKPYLEHIASKKLPVIISTGMATMEEIAAALDVLLSSGSRKENLTILQCNTNYPASFEDCNLRAISFMKKAFDLNTGFSDHTLGIEAAFAAAALGASVIEKHFTLDKSLPGPDHLASLNPTELFAMVTGIRNIEKALGSPLKEPTEAELLNKIPARKSLHAAKDLKAGQTLTRSDFITLRPGNGISPMEIDEVCKKRLRRDIRSSELLTETDFE